jgi:hypothetical protein
LALETFRLQTPETSGGNMKITYDTVTDSISCPDLTPEQTKELQSQLSAALARNDPIRTVASSILAAARASAQGQ